jgi:hypothetical protein
MRVIWIKYKYSQTPAISLFSSRINNPTYMHKIGLLSLPPEILLEIVALNYYPQAAYVCRYFYQVLYSHLPEWQIIELAELYRIDLKTV